MFLRRLFYTVAVLSLATMVTGAEPADRLESGFRDPPPEARIRCYWWWLNGNVTKASITRDLEGMARNGFGGAMIIDAGGAEQEGNLPVPKGPMFGSPEWRVLFRHALAESERVGLEISLNILSGWNLGGPTVKPEQAAKLVTWSQTAVKGPVEFNALLPQPKSKEGFYRDIAVLAYPLHHGPGPNKRPIQNLAVKGSFKEAGGSTPDTFPLLSDLPAEPGEQDTNLGEIQDISARMDPGGKLAWSVPAGDWEILRFGYTCSGSRVSTSSGDWKGLVIDYLDHASFEQYWRENIAPILADAKPYLGKTLKYAVTDSWELNGVNWTPRFAQEFRARRHYDITPYLPILAGRIVEDRPTTIRFLNDFRKTVGDLVADEHYSAFARTAAQSGLGIHPESGGPHGAPLDALKCLGRSAFPQMEYWAPSPYHRVKEEDRLFVKEAASAAHIYGKTLVAAEGFTAIGPHWDESPGSDLKPTFDRALCEGLNRHIWHAVTSSPQEAGLPGQEYFAGTHFNPQVTWWEQSPAFLRYLNRGQFMMQQGRFVADALYYYGDHVPNFVRLKVSDPARVLPGFDYDVTNEEVLLTRISVKDGRITLPDGMNYRLLVLPDLPNISLAAIEKLRDLVKDGATILGHPPERATGLGGLPDSDRKIREIATEVWANCDGHAARQHLYGKGRVVCAGTARELLLADKVPPDFEALNSSKAIDYVHRSAAGAEIYFVSNQSRQPQRFPAIFRVAGKAPELWDAVTGEIRMPASYEITGDGRIKLELDLAPYGSTFVVFRAAAGERLISQSAGRVWREAGKYIVEATTGGVFEGRLSTGRKLSAKIPAIEAPAAIEGPWHLRFDSPAATPAERDVPSLGSWTESDEDAVRYFSGHATYSKVINVPASMLGSGKRLMLSLGQVGEIAEVQLNGKSLVTIWAPPFDVDITAAARPGRNQLEIRVTNMWINRIKGDAQLPAEKRTTRTNITKLLPGPLMPSGLIGPVTLRPGARVVAQ